MGCLQRCYHRALQGVYTIRAGLPAHAIGETVAQARLVCLATHPLDPLLLSSASQEGEQV